MPKDSISAAASNDRILSPLDEAATACLGMQKVRVMPQGYRRESVNIQPVTGSDRS